MSLHTAARHLQSKGRNNDTMLVHMTPREVKGLQELAMASGGSLTINPDTGLPEAGFLESLIPMLGGAALMMIPGVGPLAAAGIMGAGYGVATGSLEKGLMAGLSAYGGANLAGSLGEMGAKTLAEQGIAQGANVGTDAVTNAAVNALPEGYTTAGNAFSPTEMLAGSSRDATTNAIQNSLSAQNFPNVSPDQLQSLQSAAGSMPNPLDAARSAGAVNYANAPVPTSPAKAMGQGFTDAFSSGSNAMNFVGNNAYPLAAAALPVAVSAFGEQGNAGAPIEDTSDDGAYLRRLSPNFRAQDPTRPNPYYESQYPTYAATGGLMAANPPTPGLMDGAQAANVNFMGKDMYPMSQQNNAYYATPSQMPTSAQQSMASYEQDTNPLTGQVSMASGGIAGYAPGGYLPSSYSTYDKVKPLSHLPVKGVYSDSDPDTAKKPADQATMIRLNKILAAANLGKAKLPKTNIKSLGDIPDVESAAGGGMMRGIGGYSDGGRMLKGPGDGMSDSIPAVIGKKQPARLADGEFVVPADVVSHLGNGSTDAGAKRLYGMMDKIRKARTGKKKQAPAVNVNKYMPA